MKLASDLHPEVTFGDRYGKADQEERCFEAPGSAVQADHREFAAGGGKALAATWGDDLPSGETAVFT